MSLTPYPTLRLKLTMPQALKLQFLPAIPGTNAAAAAARAEAAAADAEAAAAAATAATANKVDRTGDVMSGFLTLNADPTADLHAATKQYVDSHSSGIADGSITNAKLAAMPAWTVKVRNAATTGMPSDAALANVTSKTPIAGDFLFGFASTGELRKFDVGALPSTGTGLTDGDKGDITVSGSGATWTIDNDAVTYGKIQNVTATARVLGRFSGGAGDIEEGTGTQVTALLDVFTSTLKGLVPASGGGTTTFLRADGAFATPPGGGGGLSDAFQVITDGTTNSVAVGAGTFRLRTTAPLTVATQNNDATFGDNALFALANGTALSVFGVTGNASAQRADIAGTVGQVLRVSGTTLAFGSIDLSAAATVGTSDLAFANLAQGSARSVLGVTGNATADVASIQGTTDQVLRVSGAGTALAFGAIDLSKPAAATGVLQAASFPTLTGDVTTAGGVLATTIANNAVTYAKMQDVSAVSLLLGRGSAAGAGDPQEITLGTNLSMSGTTLNATGGGSGSLLAIQVFSIAGSTTYTPTSGMATCITEVVGAGGGGGGVGANATHIHASAGGGSGAYSRAFKTAAQVGASQNVTVGAKGTSASNAAGTAGGDTFVGANLAASLCGAKGGGGGARSNSSAPGGAGGAGGAAASGVGDVKAGGCSGGSGYFCSGSEGVYIPSGYGGSSFFGGGPAGVVPPIASGFTAGIAATAYGSGGGAAAAYDTGAGAGGAGSDGIVVITEYK